jgi:DNA-binding response OmpR family regulator
MRFTAQSVGMKNRILVVDDNPELLRVFSRCLADAGYEVMEASSGSDGLQLTRAKHPDVVLLDVMLPDIGGLEVCRQIKSDPALRDVLVVLCSGEAISSAHTVKGLETGADEYLTKPVSRDELLARVGTLVRLRNTIAALRTSLSD